MGVRKEMDEGKIGPGKRKRRIEEIGEEVQRGDNRPLDGWKKINKCLERETKTQKEYKRKRNGAVEGVGCLK